MKSKWKYSIAAVLLSTALAGCAHHSTNPDQVSSVEVDFLVFGDSGYFTDKPIGSGLMPTAQSMTAYCKNNECDFALMAGDNIYPDGMTGILGSNYDKEIVQKAFMDPFGAMTSNGEDFKIYVTLGNHDWGTSRLGADAQVNFMEATDPFYMDGLFYSVSPPAAKGELEIFVIDTTMLLAPTIIEEYDIGADGIPFGSGEFESAGKEAALPVSEADKGQLQWFEDALANSNAKWKIVLAHHPLWESTGSKFDQSELLRESLRPIVCKYADVYVAGHQHTLEIHEDKCGSKSDADTPLLHIVSGAAGKARTLNQNFIEWQSSKFPDLQNKWHLGDSWGFGVIQIDGDDLEITMHATDIGGTSEDITEVYKTKATNR